MRFARLDLQRRRKAPLSSGFRGQAERLSYWSQNVFYLGGTIF